MYCKRCGKALGTDRGICPFCGAMLNKEQMNEYKKMKKENMYKPELLTEKYNGQPVFYEKNNSQENKLLGLIIVFGILLLIISIVIIVVLN